MRRNVFRLCCFWSTLWAASASCTTHVFVLNEQGVWVASDTLLVHNDGQGRITRRTVCKVAVTDARIAFSAGMFDSFSAVMGEEAAVPISDPDVTGRAFFEILRRHPMYGANEDPENSKDPVTLESSAFVQVRDGHFEALEVDLVNDLVRAQPIEIRLRPGVPHGMGGRVIADERETAAKVPEYAAKIAVHPKEELLRILKTAVRQNEKYHDSGPPFTVLLLHPDGTVTDESDQHICRVPQLR